MSEQIDEIFTNYSNIFKSREEEIKSFLEKHYIDTFKEQLIQNVERIDATDRLKKAGFHPELSGWRNYYGNIIITSCEMVNGKQTRYDYKFSFVEEKLDEEKIEIVEDGLKECKRLESELLFDDAIVKIDELLDFIRQDEDKVFNKRLRDRRQNIIASKNKFEGSMLIIEKLENVLIKKEEEKDLSSIAELCQKIVEISISIKNIEITKKYRTKLEKTKKKIKSLDEISILEHSMNEYQEENNFEKALFTCDEIIKITRIIKEPILTQTFMGIRQNIQGKIDVLQQEYENALQTLNNLEKEILSDREKGDLDAIIKKYDKMILISKKIDNAEFLQKYKKLKENSSKKLNVLAQIKINEREIEEKQINEEYEDILTLCDNVTSLANQINRSDLIKKYEDLKNQIKEKIERIEQESDALLYTLHKMDKDLERKKNEKDFDSALELCYKIIEIAESLGDKDLKEKYALIKKDIMEKRDDSYAKREQEKKEQEELFNKAQEIKDVIKIDENVLPLMEQFPVGEIIDGSLNNLDALMGEISNLLETHRVEIKEEITNKTVIKSSSGEVLELEKEINIETPKIESQKTLHKVQSGLENPFDEYLEEAIITDIIPFNYEIQKIELNGEKIEQLPDKELKKEGLQLNWQLTNIGPRKKVEINYDLRRRVSRTIIFLLKDQLKIIKTHSNLKGLEQEGFYEAKLPFTNNFGTHLEGVVVEDIIPLYYVHFIEFPKNKYPDETIIAETGDLIKWNVGTMRNVTQNYQYKLLELYKFEELKIQINSLNLEALEALEKEDFDNSLSKFSKIRDLIQSFI